MENLVHTPSISRRTFCAAGTAALASGTLQRPSSGAESSKFQLKYILGSCMYGYQNVDEIFSEVRKTGASALDIWPKVHGNQREQLTELGEEVEACQPKETTQSSGILP